MIVQSINPYDETVVAEYAMMDEHVLYQRVEASSESFRVWSEMSLARRSGVVHKLAEILRSQAEDLSVLITTEMGKLRTESLAEIEKCAQCCEFYAANADELLHPEFPTATLPDGVRGFVAFEPLGVILGIMPWNFPFWQVIRFAVPTMIAGNTVLLKHAPNVTGCALAVERLIQEALVSDDAPASVLQALIADVSAVEGILAHDAVQGVSLTGSEYAGSAVASLAGKYIKRSVLELGGSDPLLVLADADAEAAAAAAVQSRMQNAGQSCIAAKRFIVISEVHEAFVDAVERRIATLRQGNPLHDDTTIAPLARVDLAVKVHRQIEKSVSAGGVLRLGGKRSGAFVEPALLLDVPLTAPACSEETFGPLAVVLKAANEQEAVFLANATRYGLGASVWTRDNERAEHLARQLRAGSVFVNSVVRSMPSFPFGGVKKSGFGRELAQYGAKEFTNIKTVYISA